MKVIDWLHAHPRTLVTVSANASVDDAIDRMLNETCVRDVFVLDQQGRIIGHLSHIRLAKILLLEHRPVHTRRQLMERVAGGTVYEFMDSEIYLAYEHEPLDEVFSRQLSKQPEDMPVVNQQGLLIGAVNLSQVLREWRNRG